MIEEKWKIDQSLSRKRSVAIQVQGISLKQTSLHPGLLATRDFDLFHPEFPRRMLPSSLGNTASSVN